MGNRLSKPHSIIIVSMQNTFPHHADFHLNVIVRTKRSGEQLECCVVVRDNNKKALHLNVSYFQVSEHVKNKPRPSKYLSFY